MEWFEELKRRGVYKATAVYTVVAWSLMQAVDIIAPIFDTPQWVNQTLILILLSGFPVVLILSWMFEFSSRGFRRESAKALAKNSSISIKDYFLAGSIATLVLLVVGQQLVLLSRSEIIETDAIARLQESEGISQILQLVENENSFEAFALGISIEENQPNNTILEELWDEFSVEGSIISQPEGAEVWVSNYFNPSSEKINLGITPLENIKIPIGTLTVEYLKDGYIPRTVISANPYYSFGNFPPYPDVPPIPTLLISETDSDEMIPVPNITIGLGVYGFANRELQLGSYEIGKYEVTNEEFKEFVDDGGYEDPSYWEGLNFDKEGIELNFEAASELLTDTTGRNGPAGWELGNYKAGEGGLPVTGVSWYEAVAYASYRGAALPSAYHWTRAGLLNAYFRTPKDYSNFSGTILPSMDESALGPFGSFNMLGNVREWVWNSKEDNKLVLGGSFADPDYMSTLAYDLSPFIRDSYTGFRIARYTDTTAALDEFLEPPNLAFNDFRNAQPASAEVFEAISDQFRYSEDNLSPGVDLIDESHSLWDLEIVSINTDYDDDRFKIHLFKPKGSTPSGLAILFGGLSTFSEGAQRLTPSPQDFDFIVSSGRVLAIIELDGSFSRYDGASQLSGDEIARKRASQLLNWHSDLGRSIDYLTTRTDLNASSLSYLGVSYGASTVTSLMSLEKRFDAAVLLVGGFTSTEALTLSSQLTHVAQIDLPTLMINGTSDNIFPVVTSAIPFYEKLGTPPDSKRQVFFDGGHESPPRGQLVSETVDWLDRFQ